MRVGINLEGLRLGIEGLDVFARIYFMASSITHVNPPFPPFLMRSLTKRDTRAGGRTLSMQWKTFISLKSKNTHEEFAKVFSYSSLITYDKTRKGI